MRQIAKVWKGVAVHLADYCNFPEANTMVRATTPTDNVACLSTIHFTSDENGPTPSFTGTLDLTEQHAAWDSQSL